MKMPRFPKMLLIIVLAALATESKATDAETPQMFAAMAVVVIPAPKGGVALNKYAEIQALAQEIITSLLPAAERRAMAQMGANADDKLSIRMIAVPDSLLFELHATAFSSKLAADFANGVAGQLEQALPRADPAAVKQLETDIGKPPVFLLWEKAKAFPVTEVRH